MSRLDGQVAVVTGAGRGIGRACAELLAAEGAAVVLVARTAAEVAAAAAAIVERGGRAEAAPGDITDDGFVLNLFEGVAARHGRLDILVNNAGMAPGGGVGEQSVEALRRCLELNVVAAYACLQQAVRVMRAHGDAGKIINIGSVRTHWTEAGGGGAYNASKYALKAVTESVARELHGSESRIAVGMVCPGVVDTTLTNPTRAPQPDWLRPEEVARAVLHAVTAPAGVNVYDVTLFPMTQKPW